MRRALLLAAVLAAGAVACAHPIHASYAEVDYRLAPARLEIALRLFSDDAEVALSAHAGKKISLESTPPRELDSLLLTLVRKTFVVKSSAGAPQTLAWVGREVKDGGQHLWIFLTCPLPDGVLGARFVNGVLRDVFSDQLNSIRISDHSVTPTRQATLLFADDREQTVVFP